MRVFTWALLMAAGVAATAGCGGRQQTEGGAGADRLTIAVIPKCTSAEFWGTVEEGAREAAEELDVAIRWEGTLTETEIAEQNRIIENMINLEVDGIALAPLNHKAMRKGVGNATAAGIPVLVFDSAVDGDAHISFVATNNLHGGQLGARRMIELLGKEGGRVVVFRYIQGAASTEARVKGFIETAQAAGVRIVADPYSEDGTVAGCKKTASNTLEGFIQDGKMQLDGVFCCNDRSSMGASAALEDLRKSGVEVKTKFVGFDFSPKLVDALQAGGIDALVVQNPHKMGYLAVKTLVGYLRSGEAPKFIDTGVEVATRARMEQDAALRKLVGAE